MKEDVIEVVVVIMTLIIFISGYLAALKLIENAKRLEQTVTCEQYFTGGKKATIINKKNSTIFLQCEGELRTYE